MNVPKAHPSVTPLNGDFSNRNHMLLCGIIWKPYVDYGCQTVTYK